MRAFRIVVNGQVVVPLVAREPVEQADRDGVFGEEPAPRLEGPVGGDAHGAAFVGGGDEPEQQLGAGVVEGTRLRRR